MVRSPPFSGTLIAASMDSDATPRPLGPHEFQLSFGPRGFQLEAAGALLRTPAGNEITTPNGALVGLLVDELGSWPYWFLEEGAIASPRPLGAYTLASLQIDRYERDLGLGPQDVSRFFDHEPLLCPQPGPEQVEQLFAWAPVDAILQESGGRIGYGPSFDHQTRQSIVSYGLDAWSRLTDAEKAVVHTLWEVHGSLLCALALTTRRISSNQFAHAILATTLAHGVFAFPPEDDDTTPEEQHARQYVVFRDVARTALAYLNASDIAAASVERLLQLGESERTEFKLTAVGVPGDPPARRRAAKYAVTNCAAAMLSCDGGWIILGADDHGVPRGLPEFVELGIDRIQLELADFFVEKLGMEPACRIVMRSLEFAGQRLVVLACPPGGPEVPVLDRDGHLVVYRRQGPRTKRVLP